MDQHDGANVKRVLRTISKEWRVPIWKVEQIIQENIDKSWSAARSNPERKALWDQYFPDGKPTSEKYILWLGKSHENREEVPYLLEN